MQLRKSEALVRTWILDPPRSASGGRCSSVVDGQWGISPTMRTLVAAKQLNLGASTRGSIELHQLHNSIHCSPPSTHLPRRPHHPPNRSSSKQPVAPRAYFHESNV